MDAWWSGRMDHFSIPFQVQQIHRTDTLFLQYLPWVGLSGLKDGRMLSYVVAVLME